MSLAYRIAQKQRRGVGRQIAKAKATPAPTLGWNAKDPLSNMKKGFATILENWFPQSGWVELRKGFQPTATNVGSGAVEAVIPYDSAGVQVLLAAGGNNIYDATAAGTATNLNSGTAFSNNLWQGSQFNGVVLLVNGADKTHSYDGSTLATAGLEGGTTTHGFDSADMIYVFHAKERIFMIEKNSATFWYASQVKAITGAVMEPFELDAVHKKGGNLVAGGTFTVDGGDGIDDYIVFLFERGDVLVYQGLDPGNANSWAIVGRFQIGPPIGRTPLVEIGADLIAITTDGYMPIRQFMGSGRTQKRLAVSDNISTAVSESVDSYGSLQGWSITLYPEANMLIANVPRVAGAQSEQHVMNTLTGAWCKFTGLNANCWAVLNGMVYFGGQGGVVNRFNVGNNDNGANIEADAQTAYVYYEGMARESEFTMYKPWLQSDNPVNVQMGLGVDFNDAIVVSESSSVEDGGAQFDVALFDEAFFEGGLSNQDDWQTAGEIGYAAAIRMKTATNAHNMKWYANSVAWIPGNIL